MKRIFLVFLFLLMTGGLVAQELACTVSVEAKQTGRTQLSIFNTLQRSLQDFINTTSWSNRHFPREQRIRCNLYVIVNSYSENEFDASLQIQSSRPVYGAAMATPILNFKDNAFSFAYEENQPLNFNPNTYENNLVSIISFYAYVILGLDADSFALEGGTDYFALADQITANAQQSGRRGWNASAGSNSRYELNQQLKSSNYRDYHTALYVYHRLGLDLMHKNVEEGKLNIMEAIGLLHGVNQTRPNTLLLRTFFDAKAHEVMNVFSGGPAVDTRALVTDLRNMAPGFSHQWRSIPSNY